MFDGSSGNVEKFFFYFENVATRGKTPEERAVLLLGFLFGDAFDFYYDEYASKGELLDAGLDYKAVKKSFIERFGKSEAPEESIQLAIAASLDPSNLRSSLTGMDSLFQKAGFDDNAKFGLMRRAVMEHAEIAQYVMFRNPRTYSSLKESIDSFSSARETFCIGRNTKLFLPKQIIQRPDAGQRKIEDKVDALANQLSELSLIVRKSQTKDSSTPYDLNGKLCSYCREPGHFSTTCPKNEHRNTRCTSCGKNGHPESRCFKKQKKEADSANVVLPDSNNVERLPTVGVTLADEEASNDPKDNVVASIKRTADGEALPKQSRPSGVIPVSSLLAPKIQTAPTKAKKKKTTAKRSSAKEGLTEYVGKYNVISELANANTGLTFGQLIRGDGEKAKSDIKRLLARGARVRRNVTAAVSTSSNVRPRRLKVVQIRAHGLPSEALLDSGAVPNLISEKFCKKLNLTFEQKSVGLTVADGQRARSIGLVSELPISFEDLHISMDFHVMENPPFDVIIGVPTLEALRGCLDFGLQQVTLLAGDRKAVLPFEYAVIEVPAADESDTDSEDFTSDSEADPNDDEAREDDLIVALAEDFEEIEATPVQPNVSEEDRKTSLLSQKVKHLDEMMQTEVLSMLNESHCIAWSLRDLSPADVPVKHHFELNDNAPIHHRSRRMAPKHNEFIRKELDNLLDAGIIVPVSSAWSFPVVIASKKDGTPRFCVDYRSLNRVMKADRWPLPRIEEIFDDLQGCSVFTTLDLFSGYWQVRMAEACKEMTTFVTRYGTFQFEVMPFGLMNAPSTFQRMMDVVLQGLPFARVYIDDVVVFSRSAQEHMGHLKEIFQRLQNCGLKVKLSKCYFAQSRVHLLGHQVDAEGIRVDEEKIMAIRNAATPTTKTELRSFLGLAGYYRRFIKGFAEISSVLHAATSGKGNISFTKEMEDAFRTLKQKLTSPAVLDFPDFNQPFIVETDASCLSLGAVLAQKKEDGKVHPIQYASRTMTDAEKKYSTCEREALAVIFALKKFRVYLLSSIPFTIITDHQALRYTFQKNDVHGRLARWLDFLAEYDFKVEYRAGKQNASADFLSRIDTGATVEEGYDEGELACLVTPLDEFNGLEDRLVSIAKYLTGFSVDHLSPEERQKVRRNAKRFAVWDGSLFRRVEKRLKLVPRLDQRMSILQTYHDEIGHWDRNSTRTMLTDRFWWPSMYKEVHDYVKTCEDCQKMTRIPRYYSGLRTPMTSLFDVFSIDFAGPLPTTPRGNKHLLICVEHLTGWPIVCPTPTATASEVITFVDDRIILPFGKPRVIVSDNGPCFTARSLEAFMNVNDIKWKTVMAYAPMSNGRAERIVGTIKGAIGKMVRTNPLDWDLAVRKVLYGYRRRNLRSGFSPYQLLYGIVPRMEFEHPGPEPVKDSSTEHRCVEALALTTNRATHRKLAVENVSDGKPTPGFSVGDFVLVAKGKALGCNIKWPAFSSKFYGPCMVASADHPRYKLISANNRHSRQGIHARRLVRYHPRSYVPVASV